MVLKLLPLIISLFFAANLFAASSANNAVPVCVTTDTANNIVPVREVAGGVPVAVFASVAAAGGNGCVPVRVAETGEQAMPVVVVSGSLSTTPSLLLVDGTSHLLLVDGSSKLLLQ